MLESELMVSFQLPPPSLRGSQLTGTRQPPEAQALQLVVLLDSSRSSTPASEDSWFLSMLPPEALRSILPPFQPQLS